MSLSKYTYIIGAGHGGIIDGVYQTAGKRSPQKVKSIDSVLYEGVNNRDNARRLVQAIEQVGGNAVNLIDSEKDIKLNERSRRVNELSRKQDCIYLDLHSDGFGNGREWHSANGFTIFHYRMASFTSVRVAKNISSNLETRLSGKMRNRGVKSANFHALRTTNCPAVLLELGFHTNEKEAEYILTDDFKDRAIRGIVDGLIDFEKALEVP